MSKNLHKLILSHSNNHNNNNNSRMMVPPSVAPATMDYHPISVSHQFREHTVTIGDTNDRFHLKTFSHSSAAAVADKNNKNKNSSEQPPNTTTTIQPPPSPLTLVFLHGGGLSGMSWANCILTMNELVSGGGGISSNKQKQPQPQKQRPTEKNQTEENANFCMQSDSNANENDEPLRPIEYCIMDFRGHGQTRTSNDHDLCLRTLVNDTVTVLDQFYNHDNSCKKISDNENLPSENLKNLSSEETKKRDIVLIGHSLGGVVAIRSCTALQQCFHVRGMIVVDVVEGTSLSNLGYIKQILKNRPRSFESEQLAIRWCLVTGMIKNQISARISVPSQLVRKELEEKLEKEKREENENEKNEKRQKRYEYVWRTDLLESERYWPEWFKGLSEAFLSVNIPKMLMVANTDRLDQSLLIASMQGRFQFKVIKGAYIGHFVQEDDPKQTAQAILSFVSRFR